MISDVVSFFILYQLQQAFQMIAVKVKYVLLCQKPAHPISRRRSAWASICFRKHAETKQPT